MSDYMEFWKYASLLSLSLLSKTHQWATLLRWVTYPFITTNTHTTAVYFDSIPHTSTADLICSVANGTVAVILYNMRSDWPGPWTVYGFVIVNSTIYRSEGAWIAHTLLFECSVVKLNEYCTTLELHTVFFCIIEPFLSQRSDTLKMCRGLKFAWSADLVYYSEHYVCVPSYFILCHLCYIILCGTLIQISD